MAHGWRIVQKKHAATAFDGGGARLYGGRWNSPGIAMVYLGSTLSLAALETLVHLNPAIPLKYAAIPVEFDDSLIEILPITSLPPDWRLHPAPPSTQNLGSTWARERRSAVLAVPSTIVPQELNYLLNPNHSDFSKIVIGPVEPFAFDPRLLT